MKNIGSYLEYLRSISDPQFEILRNTPHIDLDWDGGCAAIFQHKNGLEREPPFEEVFYVRSHTDKRTAADGVAVMMYITRELGPVQLDSTHNKGNGHMIMVVIRRGSPNVVKLVV